MAAPTQVFRYKDTLTKTANGHYTVNSQATVNFYAVQDYADPGSTNDNLTQLGDIANDHFEFGAQFEIYVGQTANKSIVAYYSGGSTYLITNTHYANNTAITATNSIHTVCYVSGTLIRTLRGDSIVDVAVENLAIGNLVVTSSGAHRPIKWLGHRTTDCRNHPRPAEIMPVRISAHALGENRPVRDLFVSPGHAIGVTMVEEVLIPASALVNGTTIQQVEVDEVTYWHVELDSHDILIAENLPAESYLDMSNRGFFAEADIVDLDALPDATLAARTHADFCRPFHSEGPVVDIVRSHVGARRATLGWTLEHEALADLHLIADGVRIEPSIRDLTARFNAPKGASDVWLVSNTSRSCVVSDSVDGRDLGVCVAALTIDDGFGVTRSIAIDDPLLGAGFYHVEDGVRRWTAGRARLPAALWDDGPEGVFLCVELAMPALPRWVAPAAEPLAGTVRPALLPSEDAFGAFAKVA